MKLTRRKFMGSSILTALAAALGLKPQFEPDERLFVSTPNEETNPFYESWKRACMGEFSRPPALILYGSAVSVSLAPQFGNFDIGIDEQPYQITYLKDNHLIIYGTCTHYVMDDELERDIPYRVDFISPNPIGYTIEQEIVPKNGVIRIVGHGSPDTEPEPAVVIKGKGVPVVFKTYDYPDSCYVKREFRIDLKASDDALLYYRPDLLPAWYIPYADRLRG